MIELIKVKSEVAKLLIFHSGTGCSEFNYPAAEVLPNIWWHLLQNRNDGVHMTVPSSEVKGFTCTVRVHCCRAHWDEKPCPCRTLCPYRMPCPHRAPCPHRTLCPLCLCSMEEHTYPASEWIYSTPQSTATSQKAALLPAIEHSADNLPASHTWISTCRAHALAGYKEQGLTLLWTNLAICLAVDRLWTSGKDYGLILLISYLPCFMCTLPAYEFGEKCMKNVPLLLILFPLQ